MAEEVSSKSTWMTCMSAGKSCAGCTGMGELGAVYVDCAGLQEAQLVCHGAVPVCLEVNLRACMHGCESSSSLHPATWVHMQGCVPRQQVLVPQCQQGTAGIIWKHSFKGRSPASL